LGFIGLGSFGSWLKIVNYDTKGKKEINLKERFCSIG
jgi:hypothetical protein